MNNKMLGLAFLTERYIDYFWGANETREQLAEKIQKQIKSLEKKKNESDK